MRRAYCTYFDRNYLVRAVALLESIRRHDPDESEIICVCFDEVSRLLLEKLALPGVTAMPAHELERGDAALLECKRDRTVVEYYWTATPTVT